MDIFPERMARLRSGTDEERKGMVSSAESSCICGACPSYTECAKAAGELLFCIRGKSPVCITERRGCTCPTCPVTRDWGLTKAYYCVRDSEAGLRGMRG